MEEQPTSKVHSLDLTQMSWTFNKGSLHTEPPRLCHHMFALHDMDLFTHVGGSAVGGAAKIVVHSRKRNNIETQGPVSFNFILRLAGGITKAFTLPGENATKLSGSAAMIIQPNGNTTFSVVFLGQEVGHMQSHLFIHTSEGSFKYKVKGSSVFSPYRLRPMVGIHIPLNSTFSPLLSIYNPHSTAIQFIEVYSSGVDFHLKLPNSETDGPLSIWEIPPYHSKPIVRIHFLASSHRNHSAYIRFRQRDSDEVLVMPLQLEVSSQPGLYAEEDMVDFGLGGSLDPPTQYSLRVFNSGRKNIKIENIVIVPASKAVTVKFEPVKVPPYLKTSLEVALITLDWQSAFETKLLGGKILIKGKQGSTKLMVPFMVQVLEGGLNYNTSITQFCSEMSWDVPRPFVVTNMFTLPIAIIDAMLHPDAEPYFLVENLTAIVLAPQQSAMLFLISTRRTAQQSQLKLETNLWLHTNISKVVVPLLSYNGRLTLNLPHGMNSTLELGTVASGGKKEIYFSVTNNNPISLELKKWETNLKWASVQLLGVMEANQSGVLYENSLFGIVNMTLLHPGHSAVFKLLFLAPNKEILMAGEVFIHSKFEKMVISTRLAVAHGGLEILPESIDLGNCFPGKHCRQALKVRSLFDHPMMVSEVISLNSDCCMNFISKGNDTDIRPQTTTLIGTLWYNLEQGCYPHCYLGIIDNTTVLYLNNFYSSITKVKVNLTWPKLFVGSDVGVGLKNVSTITFPLTQLGNTTYHPFILNNPSKRSVLVQLVMDWDYPQSNHLVDNLPEGLATWGGWGGVQVFGDSMVVKEVVDECHGLIGGVACGTVLLDVPLHGCIYGAHSSERPRRKKVGVTKKNTQGGGMRATQKRRLSSGRAFNNWQVTGDRSKNWTGLFFWTGWSIKFAEDLQVVNHPESVTIVLQPGQTVHGRLGFFPTHLGPEEAIIYIRNNLTILEIVRVIGHAAAPLFKFGNRRPGSDTAMLFELTEKHLKDCEREKNRLFPAPNLTVKRSFTARNAGELPIYINSFSINGLPCEGFGFKILNCNAFLLPPNTTRKIDVAFTPDFTLSKIQRTLSIVTSLGMEVNYTLETTLPPVYLASCSSVLNRPTWEPILYYSAISFMIFLLLCVIAAAYLESDRILKFAINAMSKERPTSTLDFSKFGTPYSSKGCELQAERLNSEEGGEEFWGDKNPSLVTNYMARKPNTSPRKAKQVDYKDNYEGDCDDDDYERDVMKRKDLNCRWKSSYNSTSSKSEHEATLSKTCHSPNPESHIATSLELPYKLKSTKNFSRDPTSLGGSEGVRITPSLHVSEPRAPFSIAVTRNDSPLYSSIVAPRNNTQYTSSNVNSATTATTTTAATTATTAAHEMTGSGLGPIGSKIPVTNVWESYTDTGLQTSSHYLPAETRSSHFLTSLTDPMSSMQINKPNPVSPPTYGFDNVWEKQNPTTAVDSKICAQETRQKLFSESWPESLWDPLYTPAAVYPQPATASVWGNFVNSVCSPHSVTPPAPEHDKENTAIMDKKQSENEKKDQVAEVEEAEFILSANTSLEVDSVLFTSWYLHSGASEPMISATYCHLLTNIHNLPSPANIKLAKSGENLKVTEVGDLCASFEMVGKINVIKLGSILIVPGLQHNLLSVRRLGSNGCKQSDGFNPFHSLNNIWSPLPSETWGTLATGKNE
uniref:Transmembrane protein 131 n=2 Tax=Timema TaxID=61471 RepID=A0A7R8V9X9_TIMDO|nr:unnamed protein product [Timema douglasi]